MSWRYSLEVRTGRKPFMVYVTDELNQTVPINTEGFKTIDDALKEARTHAGLDIVVPLALA